MIVRYEAVRRYVKRSGKCSVCGRRVTRQRTFRQTVSPFHSAVTPGMTYAEAAEAVRQSVIAECKAWTPDFTHEKCEGAQR